MQLLTFTMKIKKELVNKNPFLISKVDWHLWNTSRCLWNISRIRVPGNRAKVRIVQDAVPLGVQKGGLSREDEEQPHVWVGHGFWESWWEHRRVELILLNHANLPLVKPHITIWCMFGTWSEIRVILARSVWKIEICWD